MNTTKALLSLKRIRLFFILSIMAMPFATGSEFLLPDGALGLVSIESPRVGTLLQLRGIAGKGYLLEKVSESRCLKSRIKIAAGDFGGSRIGIRKSEPIAIAIYSPIAMAKLADNDEIVSEDYQITDSGSPAGDLVILEGLSINHGFVLNLGEWSIFHPFGRKPVEVDCQSELI